MKNQKPFEDHEKTLRLEAVEWYRHGLKLEEAFERLATPKWATVFFQAKKGYADFEFIVGNEYRRLHYAKTTMEEIDGIIDAAAEVLCLARRHGHDIDTDLSEALDALELARFIIKG